MPEDHNPFDHKVERCAGRRPIQLLGLLLMRRGESGESFGAAVNIGPRAQGHLLGTALLAYPEIEAFRGVCRLETAHVRGLWGEGGNWLTIKARTAMSLLWSIQNAQEANHRLPS